MKPLVVLLLLLVSATAYTCTCTYPEFEDQLAQATVVFAGRVIKVEPGGQDQISAQFKVLKAYKGTSEQEITIRTNESSAACGYPFELQSEYLIYATGKEVHEVTLCSRSRLLKDAKEDLALLEKPDKTEKKEASKPQRDPFVEMDGEQANPHPKEIPKALNITNAVIVGITKKPDGYVALVRATNNKVYFLKVGDKLDDGVVLKIDDNAVTFRQFKGYRSVLVKKELRSVPD
jgi:hypothetical protein